MAQKRVQVRHLHRGFTMAELLVVIGIIVLLLGILIPVVGGVRERAQAASTQSLIAGLSAAAERYYSEHQAYPGPLPEEGVGIGSVIAAPGFAPATPGEDSPIDIAVSGSENLVLGLLGGLTLDGGGVAYNPSLVGRGPVKLTGGGVPKIYSAYFEADPSDLSWHEEPDGQTGHFHDDAAAAGDTMIPEFVDRFASPMPILYLRALPKGNPVVGMDAFGGATYYLPSILHYTQDQGGGTYIGVGRDKITAENQPHGLAVVGDPAATLTGDGPFDALPYLTGPGGGARNASSFILISAGIDRVYGTRDDITNFGSLEE